MTVRQKRDGAWLVQVEKYGERRRKTIRGDKREAQRVEWHIKNSLEKERPHLGLAEALRGYTATLRTRAKRATVRSAEFHGSALEEALGHTFNVAELRQADLDQAVESLRGKGWRDTSINGALRVLKAALRLAHREGKITAVPHIARLREQRKLPSVLSPTEVDDLLEAAEPQAALAILLAAHAGLRHQEILHLDWHDVDWRAGVLRVTAKDGWSPKTHTEREVPMNATLRRALAEAAGPVELLEYVPARSGWVFPDRSGRRPLPNLYEPVREAFKAAGLWDRERRPGLHMLRRTYASTLLAKGVDLKTVQELGGWESTEVLTRHYLVSNMDLKRRAVALLEG